MRRRGLGIIMMHFYLIVAVIVALVTARLVANVAKVARVVESSESKALMEAFVFERLRDDCHAAQTLDLENSSWLKLDNSLMWFIDDSGLRRLDPSGEIELFPFVSTSSRFEQSDGLLVLQIRDRSIALSQKGLR